MFLILLIQVGCIFLMMGPGFWGRRRGWISPDSTRDLARLLLGALYPCLIFTAIFRNYGWSDLGRDWLLPAGSLGIMLFGAMVGLGVGRRLGFSSSDEKRAFHFQCTMCNYAFLPLALVLALYGSQAGAALLLSTLGAELALWTAGVAMISGHGISRKALRHLLSPPLCALYAAILLRGLCDLAGWTASILEPEGQVLLPAVFSTLERMGLVTVPLAMVVAGSRLAELHPIGLANPRVWLLAGLRLLAIPIALLLLLRLLPMPELTRQVLSVVAVMPVAMASFLMSELYGGDRNYIGATVLVTHLAALLTVPLLLTLFL